jgi:hypothetical protein
MRFFVDERFSSTADDLTKNVRQTSDSPTKNVRQTSDNLTKNVLQFVVL